jgi:hypothetical protein
MLDIHGTIPNILGSTCEALIKQEYWYQGKKTADVHVLFLKIKNGKWQRFFFDCGTLCWKEVDAVDVFEPKVWEPSPDDYRFPQTEIGYQNGLIDQVIEHVNLTQLPSSQWPELHIHFSNGILLILQDFCEHQLLELRQSTRD